MTADPNEITPVDWTGEFFLKRDDAFGLHGVRGGKVRAAYEILRTSPGIVGYGSRRSNTAAAIAAASWEHGKEAIFHTSAGDDTAEMTRAAALNLITFRERPGYMGVLRQRAAASAKLHGWPLGLEHPAAVASVERQTAGLRRVIGDSRIVVSAGACVTLAGILAGLRGRGMTNRVLAVRVGAPINAELLTEYDPDWRDRVTVVESPVPYDRETRAAVGGVTLDPLYEAKCERFLEPGDTLWVAGMR